jgi:5-methylcytosine-specific restriction endonuclease McrA
MRIPKPKEQEGRVELTQEEKRAQLLRKVKEQKYRCNYCGRRLTLELGYFSTAVREHIKPGKIGGCKDDSDSNICAACVVCNGEKGSQRNWKGPQKVDDCLRDE